MKQLAALIAGLVAAVVFTTWVTWPQALYLTTHGADHQDTFFSMWRLGWIAHALPRQPLGLFDANIFHPAKGTLAFSDAMLLEGVLAAPLFWLGFKPVLIYNVMLAAGFVGSGVAMFVLARRLTGAIGPSLIATAIFTMAPFRIEHFMHLELQWTMWIPLTFWAVSRAVDEGSNRFGALAGLFMSLQIVSCVYYGAFLAIALTLFVPLMLLTSGRRAASAIVPLVTAGLVVIVLAAPYAIPYVRNAQTLGLRDPGEVARFSALPVSYIASPPQNVLWGWTSDWGGPEINLYPGVVAVALALAAIAHRQRRLTIVYAAVLMLAIDLSFGSHGYFYPVLARHAGLLQGLRAPARFSIIALCALAALAALGAQAVQDRFGRSGGLSAGAVFASLLMLIGIDYANRGMYITRIADGPYDVYRMMQSAGPGVVVELPLPRANALPGNEQFYAFWSRSHWQPLVNGYSGYYPRDYIHTLAAMERFPDDASIGRLRRLGVRYVVVHRGLYEPQAVTPLLVRFAARSELKHFGTFRSPSGPADLFGLVQ